MKKLTIYLLVIAMVVMLGVPVFAASAKANIGINVLLNTEVSEEILSELGSHGKVQDVLYEINGLTMKIKANELAEIQALSFVEAANPDAERKGSPVDTVALDSMEGGFSTWNNDVINVTDYMDARTVEETGEGVYIAVLDTGLVSIWKQYFPDERIATEYAIAFGGGGGDRGTVSTQPNKWERDTNSHGTHVTSSIIGYSLGANPIDGVAPNAKIIPVKVLNQSGSGWSSVITRGINYVASLKEGPLADSSVVINMSLGGPVLDALEQAAIDRAIEAGVIIVASAGNEGEAGMGFPGAYEPVISVAAAGWQGEWIATNPAGLNWWLSDVAEPTDISQIYITEFSSRELPGQNLDVAAPGSWIVGPYNPNLGSTSYYYMGGTSMASPHVAGIVALIAEKNDSLNAFEVEAILEESAATMTANSLLVVNPNLGIMEEVSWGADATGYGLVDAAAALAITPE